MPTFRVKKDKHFTIISNMMLQRSEMSLSLKGLLCYFLSLPDASDVNVNSLIKSLKEGKKAIYSSINEGIKVGYIAKKSVRNKKGHHPGLCYTIFEEPQERESVGQEPNERQAGFVDAENAPLQNNNDIKKEKNKALVTQVITSNEFSDPGHKASATAFSQEDNSTINEMIGQKLTLAQIHGVKQKLYTMPLRLGDTVATLQHAVLTSLVDGTQFTACHPHFAKKLNTIAKCYRAGTYFPEIVLAVKQQAQQVQKDQHEQLRLSDLRVQYRELAGDVRHYETLLRENLTVDEAAKHAPIYDQKKRVLQTMKHEIDVLKTQLGQNTGNLSGLKKHIGIEQPNTSLSTELPTKSVNNSAAENGDVDSKSLGEGGC